MAGGILVFLFAVSETGAATPAVVGIGAGIAHQTIEPVAFLREGKKPSAVNPDLVVSGRGLDDHSPRFPRFVRTTMVTTDHRPGKIVGQKVSGLLCRLHQDVPAVCIFGPEIPDV